MQRPLTRICSLLLASLSLLTGLARADGETPPQVSFVRDVAPILVSACQACHGPKTAESNYRLDSFELLMKPGDFGEPPVTAGKLDESRIYQLVIAEDPHDRMPNNGSRLTPAEIAIIRGWIEQGAKFDGESTTVSIRDQIPRDLPRPAAPKVYPARMPITAVVFTPDGNQLLVGGYHELLLWDTNSDKPPARLGNMPERASGLAFSPNKALLAVAGGAPGIEGEVRIVAWDNGINAGTPPKVLAALEDVVFDVAFRPDGKQLAAGSADGTVRIFDLVSGAERLKISNHSNWVTGLCYSPDGKTIATASRDRTSKLFDADAGTLLVTHSEPTAAIRGVAFAPDGKSVLSATGDRLQVWNVQDGKTIGEMPAFGGEIYALSRADAMVFTAALDRTVRQFKLADRSLIRTLTLPSTWAVSLARSPATHRIAAGCNDGTVAIWDTETGSLVKQFLALPVAEPKPK